MISWYEIFNLNNVEQEENPSRTVIILPTYNRQFLIKHAVASVLSQTYKNWELWILDDASTDNTESVVESICKGDERVKYIKMKEKSCPVELNELGCRIAIKRGKYWTRLASDDTFLPGKLEADVKFMEGHEDNGACYGPFFKMDAQGKILYRAHESEHIPYGRMRERIQQTFIMSWANICVRCSVLQKMLVRYGHFSYPQLENMEDWIFNAKLITITIIGWVGGEPQACYRLHSGQAGTNSDVVGEDNEITRAIIPVIMSEE